MEDLPLSFKWDLFRNVFTGYPYLLSSSATLRQYVWPLSRVGLL